MKFKIEVGEVEKHLIEFNFSQLAGSLEIRVDNQVILQTKRLLNEPVREVYDLLVGEREKVAIRIEKQRKPLLGHHRRVWINNRLAQAS